MLHPRAWAGGCRLLLQMLVRMGSNPDSRTMNWPMSRKRYNPADVEILLAISHEAEVVGVSSRTVVDVDELTRPLAALMCNPCDGPSDRWRFVHLIRAAVPLAACLAIVVGLGRLGDPLAAPLSDTAGLAQSDRDCLGSGTVPWISLASFAGCLSGPGQPISTAECACADLDRDGDVDLLDYGEFQRLAGSRLN